MEKYTNKSSRIIVIILFVIIVLILGYLISKNLFSDISLDKTQNIILSQEEEEERLREILSRLEKFILLPDETPTLAEITNVNVLREKNFEFYKNGENGDLLIIYSDKAILYRESENKIINVAPVFIEDQQDISE